MVKSRREFVGVVSAFMSVGLTGCSGILGSDGRDRDAPDPDTNPRDLLPEVPEGWEVDTDPNQQAAGMIGAEAGFGQSFVDPNGTQYSVEFYRFPSKSEAEETSDFYADSGWSVYVVRGNFAFAAKGPDMDKVYWLC